MTISLGLSYFLCLNPNCCRSLFFSSLSTIVATVATNCRKPEGIETYTCKSTWWSTPSSREEAVLEFSRKDDLNEIEMQDMEAAREAYIAAAKAEQDEGSIAAVTSARLRLQSLVIKQKI